MPRPTPARRSKTTLENLAPGFRPAWNGRSSRLIALSSSPLRKLLVRAIPDMSNACQYLLSRGALTCHWAELLFSPDGLLTPLKAATISYTSASSRMAWMGSHPSILPPQARSLFQRRALWRLVEGFWTDCQASRLDPRRQLSPSQKAPWRSLSSTGLPLVSYRRTMWSVLF